MRRKHLIPAALGWLAGTLAAAALALAPGLTHAGTFFKPLVVSAGEQHQLPANAGIQLDAGVTANASLNVPCAAGVAPSSPNDGDIWCTTAGVFIRVGSTTVGPIGPGVGGFGTVTSVGLSLPAIFTVSGSPVTTSGTLTGTLANETANLVFAGPSSGGAAAPTFRSLVGADLPTPGASSLGGVDSFTCSSHQWVSSLSTGGAFACTQPAFSDLTGSASAGQLSTNLSAAIDSAFCSAQGSILYRSASAWVCLAPGTNNYVLLTQGAGANPIWSQAVGACTNPCVIGPAQIGAGGAAPPVSPGCTIAAPQGSLCMRQDNGLSYSNFDGATAIARVQEKACWVSYACTITSTPTAGNYLVAVGFSATAAPSTASGWTAITLTGASSGGCSPVATTCYIAAAYHLVTTSDTTSQTPFTGSGPTGDLIFEVSGADPLNFLNSLASAQGQVSGDLGTTSLSYTTTTASNLALSAASTVDTITQSATTLGGTTSWTNQVSNTGDVGGSAAISSPSTAVNGTATYSGGFGDRFTSAAMIVLKPSSDPLTTGWQQVSYLTVWKNGGSTITGFPGPRSVNCSTNLSCSVDADQNITMTATGGLASISADNILANFTGSSAVPVGNSVPNCPDTGGNHLNFASHALSCGTSSSGGGGGGQNYGNTVTAEQAFGGL